jgi:hypothetical protein
MFIGTQPGTGRVAVPQVGTPAALMKLGPSAIASRLLIRLPCASTWESVRP